MLNEWDTSRGYKYVFKNNKKITCILSLYHIVNNIVKFHKKAQFTINARIKNSKEKYCYIKVCSDNFIEFVKT